MKRRRQLVGLINTQSLRHIKRDRQSGSIVVEAAIVLPIIILLLIAFFIIIHLHIVQMSLQSTAQQMAMITATHYYPIEELQQYYRKQTEVEGTSEEEEQTSSSSTGSAELIESSGSAGALGFSESAESSRASGSTMVRNRFPALIELMEQWLPVPANTLVPAFIQLDYESITDTVHNELAKVLMQSLLAQFIDERWTKKEYVIVERVELPHLTDRTRQQVTILLSYTYPIKLPLLNQTIVLKAVANERAWLPDTVAANIHTKDEDSSEFIRIVSIEPAPLAPGKKATAVILTSPNTTVNFNVYYKSGQSRARNLGMATTDEFGEIAYTWHVSGNTTPGLWKLVAEVAAEPHIAAEQYFTVRKSNE